MFTFRQKIFVTYVVVFLLFIAGMYPFASRTVKEIAIKAMNDRAVELIEKIRIAPNDEALIRHLKEQKPLIFFRVSVITNERKVLYDSHIKRLLGPRFSQEYIVDHPEVTQAFKEGIGYAEDYSDLLGQKFSYVAKSFDFHGKPYVIRIAFPYKYVVELTHDFEIGVLTLATAVLLLFSIMTWFIMNYLTSPIPQIINAVKPYEEGILTIIPEIKLRSAKSDEFEKLANTLNSLSAKVQKHIDSLTYERNEKEAILESLIEGVIAVDVKMAITYANQSALKLLNFEKEFLIGQNFSILQQQKCYELLIACQEQNKPLTDTIQNKQETQKQFIDIVAAPQKENRGAILVLQDKTSHYKLMEMRKDFIANASHELKTPLTIILGFAETLHDHSDLPPETYHEITSKIVRNCKRMTSLIKDLLTLSDVENLPSARLIECDLLQLIKDCCENLKDAHPEAVIHISSPENVDLRLTVDPHLMQMAFFNLIENAAKYSTAPADINVALEKSNKYIKISIADKGIGIPVADLEHIFERFYTVDKARSRKLGGSGLGLSIVQTIIEKHGGQVSVKSELGVGSTFTILLPT